MQAWLLKRISVASRIAFCLVTLSIFTLLFAHPLGILPDLQRLEVKERIRLCNTLAISCTLLAQRDDQKGLTEVIRAVVERNPDVSSGCVRLEDNRILEQFGDHEKYWLLKSNERSTQDNIFVPIYKSPTEKWGTVELSFVKPNSFLISLQKHPLISLSLFTLIVNSLMFRLYMGRVLSFMDPSKSVPTHVRSTLNTLAEGVVVLDNEQRIMLTNEAFTRQVGRSADELQGTTIDKLPWAYRASSKSAPWLTAESSPLRTGVKLSLCASDQEDRTFRVNASAIIAEDGAQRGTIASFDDITLMEKKEKELSRMVKELKISGDELNKRNEELQYYAMRDPLTGCLNRRVFFEKFETHWTDAYQNQHPLSCLITDVDHFKSVNDNHGHSTGDEVLRQVAKAICDTVSEVGIVCRYGGEEFCVLLPEIDLDIASHISEQIRIAIQKLNFNDLKVTASFGVSSIAFEAESPQELLDQADKCLYNAKRSGRNRVVRQDDALNVIGPEEDSLDLDKNEPASSRSAAN